MSKPTDNRRAWLVCSVLVLVTLALYWPVWHFDFVEYDDPDYASENQTIQQGITSYGLMWAFVDAHAANWLPLTWISHMLDCQLFGVNPGAHHMVNVAFHCANTALLFLLLRSMTGAFWRSAFVAALFAWHPLRVESVAWISERKDVLSGFFFMLTLLAYTRYVRCPVPGSESEAKDLNSQFSVSNLKSQLPPFAGSGSLLAAFRFPLSRRQWYALTLVLFTLGLLSKAMLVTVPFVLLLLDFWPLNRLHKTLSQPTLVTPPNHSPSLLRRHAFTLSHPLARLPRALLIEKIPFLLLSLAMGVITVFAQRSGGAVIALKSESLLDRFANTLTGYLGYFEKIFWPHNLTFLYLRSDGASSVLVAACALVLLLAVSCLAWLRLTSHPYLAVGWLWFLGMLLPVSPLVQVGLQSIADRYTYLPGIGLGILGGWGLCELAKHVPRYMWRTCLAVSSAAGLLICATLTVHQVGYWRNTETLMQHALEIDPNNYIAHQDLSVYYSKTGKLEAAREHRDFVRKLEQSFAQAQVREAPEDRTLSQQLPSAHE